MKDSIMRGTVLCLAAFLFAGKASAGEAAPAKAPVKPAAAPAKGPAKLPAEYPELKAALKAHVEDSVEEESGKFIYFDDEAEADRSLTLKSFDDKGVRALPGGRFILRAEFFEKGDKEVGIKDAVVLIDFTLAKVGKNWVIEDEAIFSVNGTARFAYAPDNKRVPIGGKKAPAMEEEEMSEPAEDIEMGEEGPAPDKWEDEGGDSDSETL